VPGLEAVAAGFGELGATALLLLDLSPGRGYLIPDDVVDGGHFTASFLLAYLSVWGWAARRGLHRLQIRRRPEGCSHRKHMRPESL
jgi:hypothetical protein